MLRVIIIWMFLLLATAVSARETGGDVAQDSVAEGAVSEKYRWRMPDEKRRFTASLSGTFLFGNRDSVTIMVGGSYFHPLNNWIGIGGSAGIVNYRFDYDYCAKRKNTVMPYIAPTVSFWTDYALQNSWIMVTPTAEVGVMLHVPFTALAPEIGNSQICHPYRTTPVSFMMKAGVMLMTLPILFPIQIGYCLSSLDTYRQYDPVTGRFHRKLQHGIYVGIRYDL